MDFQVSQRTRYLLQTRVRRLRTATSGQYLERVIFFLDFIKSNDAFRNIINETLLKSAITEDEITSTLNKDGCLSFKTEVDYITGTYYCLKYFIEKSNGNNLTELIIKIHYFFTGEHKGISDCLEGINDSCVEILAEHLDEQLDASQTIMLLLYKYKHMIEWFNRSEARAIAEGEHTYYPKTSKEKGLASNLYGYMYEQGIEFHIEPSSVSGEADLITSQRDESRIILDAKYISSNFSESEIKRKVSFGFAQVFTYCCDFNSEFGYLVVFKNHASVINIEADKQDDFSYVNLNGKIIFFVVVDIFEYKKPASKRGAPKVVNIFKSSLIDETKNGKDV